ncbi:MAG: hypothetical protein AB7E79_02225 [Rhodospirillaceae bacterium]
MFRRAALVLVLGLAACSDGPAVTANTAPSATDDVAAAGSTAQIMVLAKGTALPAGYKVDPSRTMIFGTDEKWTGRLTYTAAGSADEVFDFLHKEMPNFGWVEISAMRSENSLLTFSSESTGRLATINIRRGSVMGSTQVDMVVAPQAAN